MSVEILSNAAQMQACVKFHLKRLARWMTLKVTQGHWNCRYSLGHVSVLLVICRNNVSILHRFQDIITFTLYVTTYDLEKSFAFNKTVKLQATFALQFTCKQIVVNTCCNPGGAEVKKVSNSKSDLQASRSLKSLLFVPFDWSHTISY